MSTLKPQKPLLVASASGRTFYGLNGQTIVGDANGAWTITANGTNQNITLTPSGTGGIVISSTDTIIKRNAAGRVAIVSSGTTSGLDIFESSTIAASIHTVSGVMKLVTQSNQPITFQINAVEKARLAATTGNLLLGGLTTDGTGVLQFPAATTSVGGIAFGSDINYYRDAAGSMVQYASSGNAVFTINKAGGSVLGLLSDGTSGYVSTTGSLNLRTNGATTALTLDSSQNATFVKLITSYNGIATAGWGVPAIQGNGTIAATTNARSAAVATYTVGAADGTFVVSGNILITTSTTFSFSLDCSYTDESNVARVLVLPLAQLAGTFVATGLATNVTGAGPYESASLTIRCKASTSITIRPSAGGTYTTVVYNVNASIRQIA